MPIWLTSFAFSVDVTSHFEHVHPPTFVADCFQADEIWAAEYHSRGKSLG